MSNNLEIRKKMRNFLPHHDMGVPPRLSVVTSPSYPLAVKREILSYPDDRERGTPELRGAKLLVETSSYNPDFIAYNRACGKKFKRKNNENFGSVKRFHR
jgi:hypothetical protein